MCAIPTSAGRTRSTARRRLSRGPASARENDVKRRADRLPRVQLSRKCNSIPCSGVYSGVVLVERISGREASPRNPLMHFGDPIEFRAFARIAWAADCLMGALSLTIVACGLLLPVRAQTGGAVQVWSSPGLPSTQARGEKYTVSGTVINAVSGEPVGKALVQLYDMQQRTMFSDGDGRFQFDGILAGRISLNAQKPGYFGEQEVRRQGQLQVEVGPKSESVVLKRKDKTGSAS